MIKLQNYTPEIYYKESRDFQFIGRLFDLVLNAVKTDVDLLYYVPLTANSDEKLLELLSFTLGFNPRHQYTTRQLKTVCSVFTEIVKYKGSIKSLKIACEALFNAMDISQALDYDFSAGKNNTELNLYIPQEFEDITILNDLLAYVLPAGMSCNIIKELHIKTTSNTNIGISDTVRLEKVDVNSYSRLPQFTDSEDTNLAAGIINTGDAIKALMNERDETTGQLIIRPGFSANSEIIKLEDK